MTHRLHSVFHMLLLMIALCCTILVFSLNFLYTSEVIYDTYETVIISAHAFPSLMMSLGVITFVTLIFLFHNKVLKLNEKHLFIYLSAIYLVLAIYFIHFSDDLLRGDASKVHSAALNALHNEYPALQKGGYMYMQIQQIGLMLYDQLLASLNPNPAFNFLINLLFVIGINYNTLRISRELFQESSIHILTILLSFGFLPQFFFIMFAYGLIPGYFFISSAFYYTLRFCHTYNHRYAIRLLISASIAIILKKNYLIGALAIGIYLLLHALKTKRLRLLLILPFIALAMLLPSSLIQCYYEKKAGVQLDNPVPSILWVAMGTDFDNVTSGPGWFDYSSLYHYEEAGGQTDKATEIDWAKLRQNIDKMLEKPTRTIRFFRDKTISQWCDPLYQSIWSGPLAACGQFTHTPLLQSLYSGGIVEDIVALYAKAFLLMLWSGVILFLLIQGCSTTDWQLLFLYFIGGLLFHTFWEAKSQYTYTYAFCLIPFSSFGILNITKQISRWYTKRSISIAASHNK